MAHHESSFLTSLVHDRADGHRGCCRPSSLLDNCGCLLGDQGSWWRVLLDHGDIPLLDNGRCSSRLLNNGSSTLLDDDSGLTKKGGGVSVQVACKRSSSHYTDIRVAFARA